MKNILIITFILLKKPISKNNCNPSSCSSWGNLNRPKFFDCVCSDCSKIASSSAYDSTDFDLCRTSNKKLVSNFNCSNCHRERTEEKSTSTGNSWTILSIIIIIIIIYISLYCYCYSYYKFKNNNNSEGVIRIAITI